MKTKNKREKIDLYALIKPISPEETIEIKRKGKLERAVGIFPIFDTPSGKGSGTPKNYKYYLEYVDDKFKVSQLIDENQPIPEELYNKLVTARIDLQERGFLPIWNEEQID